MVWRHSELLNSHCGTEERYLCHRVSILWLIKMFIKFSTLLRGLHISFDHSDWIRGRCVNINQLFRQWFSFANPHTNDVYSNWEVSAASPFTKSKFSLIYQKWFGERTNWIAVSGERVEQERKNWRGEIFATFTTNSKGIQTATRSYESQNFCASFQITTYC